MQAVQSIPQELKKSSPNNGFVYGKLKANADALIIQTSLLEKQDKSDVGINSVSKALTVSAKEIVSKLNELLKEKLPDGIESLKPEDVTPEKTSDNIVSGITAMFSAYAKSNEDLEPEELISRFMAAARKGVDQGYGEASEILEGLGAFEFDGVKEGIEKTKALIEEKLKAFESSLRKQYGLDTDDEVAENAKEVTTSELVLSAGGNISLVV